MRVLVTVKKGSRFNRIEGGNLRTYEHPEQFEVSQHAFEAFRDRLIPINAAPEPLPAPKGRTPGTDDQDDDEVARITAEAEAAERARRVAQEEEARRQLQQAVEDDMDTPPDPGAGDADAGAAGTADLGAAGGSAGTPAAGARLEADDLVDALEGVGLVVDLAVARTWDAGQLEKVRKLVARKGTNPPKFVLEARVPSPEV